MCKLAYHSTNKKNYSQQIIRYLIRTEAVHLYKVYLCWRNDSYPENPNVEEDCRIENRTVRKIMMELSLKVTMTDSIKEILMSLVDMRASVESLGQVPLKYVPSLISSL